MPNKWHNHYMAHAILASIMSKDSTKVGAALVTESGAIPMTGYNGPPRGVRDLPERFVRPEKYLFASHAEMNVIAQCAAEGIRTKGCTLYVTHPPCSTCSRLIIQAGIKRVYYGRGESALVQNDERRASMAMLDESGIECIAIDEATENDPVR